MKETVIKVSGKTTVIEGI